MDPHNQNTQTNPQPSQVPQSSFSSSPVKNKIARRLKSFLSTLLFIGGVLATAYFINQTIFHSYYVVGSSMTPTLQNNDWLIIEKVSRSLSFIKGEPYIPQRGQVVVLDSSLIGANGREEQLIKRVMGVPGDTVVIEKGKVTVKNAKNPKGFSLDDQLGLTLEATYSDSRIETTVPEGQVFVLGDNRGRNGSYDSRSFGTVEAYKLEGRLWARVLPLYEAKLFE